MYEILIVDDDPHILDMVELVLKREGYRVLRAATGSEALYLLNSANPDLFVIDSILPDMNGVMLCRQLRMIPHLSHTPIVFLTGQGATQAMVEALMSGGDDYIRKPFVPRELVARVRALIRRSVLYSDANAPLLQLRTHEYRVFVNNREIMLTRVEFAVLKFLCQTPHHLHTAEDLLQNVWNYPLGAGDAALVRNHIHNIRRKIEVDPERPLILQSRHGRGYVIKARTQIDDQATIAPSDRAAEAYTSPL